MPGKDNAVSGYAQQILSQVRKVVVGKDSVLLWVLAAILARGHILLEDIPGVGKTTMALAFSRVLDLSYSRVQFTPDVLPSDVTGYSIPDPQSGELRYQSGAVLCNLFLADELNRATSRTQSALLEAMEDTFLSDSVVRYIVSLVNATRGSEDLLRGASPRATLSITAMAKAVARLRGRDYVTPGDVKEVFSHTVAHRLILSPKAEAQGKTAEAVLREILTTIPAPRLR